MASEIRVNQIQNRSGLSTVTFSDSGVVISGITTISDLRTSGNTIVAAGTTAAPSISPTGDSNTGIFFPAPDTVAIAEGGVEALRIDSSANIGINSTSPARKLDVVDSGASGSVIRSRVTTNNGGYLAYEALNSSGTSVFSVTHNGRINLSENIVFASGQGLDFSATANSSGTMTSELLSDYEEGTFTITISGSSSGSGNVSGTARYTKIGRLCYVFYRIDGQNFPTFSGQMRISLPFTAYSGGTGNETQLGSKIYFYPLANWDGVANCAGFWIQSLPNTATAVFGIEILDADRQNSLSSSNSSLSNSSGNYFSASLTYEVAP